MRKKLPIKGGMTVKAYPVLEAAIEAGLAIGWNRTHKHTDAPDPETAQETILRAVMDEISAVFLFNEEASYGTE